MHVDDDSVRGFMFFFFFIMIFGKLFTRKKELEY